MAAAHGVRARMVDTAPAIGPTLTEVAKMIDASHEDLYNLFPNMDEMVSRAALMVRLRKLFSRLGLGRAAKSLPREDLNIFLAVASGPKHQEAALAEFAHHRFYFGPRSEVPRTLGDTPLIVVTAGYSLSGGGKPAAGQAKG